MSKEKPFFFFPVFFRSSLLEELKKSSYKIEMSTKYLGTVSKGNKWIMTFGISPKGFVHFWLGDLLDNLESDDYSVFMKHRAVPDRLGKHFTKSQLEAKFVSDEDEN